MSWRFIVAREYNRSADIHGRYGGQHQGGISTPAAAATLFLFTGSSGEQHGYADAFLADGTFSYTGEGQVGDMAMIRGDAAVRDHAANGKDILLFQTLGSGKPVRYLGRFICGGWVIRRQPDTLGNERAAIVFSLVSADAVRDAVLDNYPAAAPSSGDLVELRALAIAAATVTAQAGNSTMVSTFMRSQAVRNYVLARARGCCESCGAQAPFVTSFGMPYLKAHHIRKLSDGGPDHPSPVAGICPNCHRRAHHGADAAAENQRLAAIVAGLESHPAHH